MSDELLGELRWHLCLGESAPASRSLPYETPVLTNPNAGWMPGGSLLALREQDSRDGRCLGLFVRIIVLDDEMYELIQTVPPWLAQLSATQGWVGLAREEMALEPWLNFYVQGSHAYAGGPGESPQGLSATAPPFTLTRTSW